MKAMLSKCIACGAIMESAEDHALGDLHKPYCRYCARPDGSMQCYVERLENYAGWLVDTQGLDVNVARNQARIIMAQLPAWESVNDNG
jgi:hypothetical protein